jgi:hypothetical protein
MNNEISDIEFDTLCYQINTVDKLVNSPYYEKMIHYVSDIQLNFFHIQCQCANLEVVKYLLEQTHFKDPINYSQSAYKKSNALFLIVNQSILDSNVKSEVIDKLINTFIYLIDNTELGSTFIDNRNNNIQNILMRLVFHGGENHMKLIKHLSTKTDLFEKLLFAQTDDKQNTLSLTSYYHYDNSVLIKLLEMIDISLNHEKKHQLITQTLEIITEHKMVNENRTAYEFLMAYQEKLQLEKNLQTKSKTKNIKL